ncbi:MULTISPECIES: 3-hydroxyacyl-CoA dehydrogenase [Corynebacterium]|uniref:3-hydroxyacyl-CoA dehydrogenase, NAD binding domain protein n=1 Tax=Corynebacterium lipophiloflavum (strain ATCC 700352 / DSM 44291 / CCUG 37336 / JCM 10383 / DMMZ 1944) TaxID=525263 RepID=C0XQY7_CORLD|nr:MULTISPECIES: 3-hydroxyacyl-CoA dehydrogenase [Corynebacterium]EEI17336.1 3-hydroxyacyl-CoA dehydrogenase, NAD binding domain protein [Corynebacterium lipophiloflavum DSM 44291]MDN8622943.1 3-hydroxyacyl-CoA dehydrogenase [Corynebacterium sanguinis]WNI13193.1 3-hydroxyacyl-CoA dehydrogenase [Corynebacterium sp. Z-1]
MKKRSTISGMDIKNVTVLGAGVLGAQIALVTAFRGFNVVSWDINDDALAAAAKRFDAFGARIVADLDDATEESMTEGRARLTQTTDLEEAVREADLIIEAVPENIDIKRDVLGRASAAASDATIFATNTSTLLPSEFADAVSSPERFLALHFANNIWIQNTAEIMPHAGTDLKYVDVLVDFAERIGMVPVKLKKEQPGYILNTLFVPWLKAGQYLLANEIAEPADIDRTWRNSTGSPRGPFEIMDIVGLRTVLAVGRAQGNKEEWQDKFSSILEEMIAAGHIGVESGQGFYTYDK